MQLVIHSYYQLQGTNICCNCSDDVVLIKLKFIPYYFNSCQNNWKHDQAVVMNRFKCLWFVSCVVNEQSSAVFHFDISVTCRIVPWSEVSIQIFKYSLSDHVTTQAEILRCRLANLFKSMISIINKFLYNTAQRSFIQGTSVNYVSSLKIQLSAAMS